MHFVSKQFPNCARDPIDLVGKRKAIEKNVYTKGDKTTVGIKYKAGHKGLAPVESG